MPRLSAFVSAGASAHPPPAALGTGAAGKNEASTPAAAVPAPWRDSKREKVYRQPDGTLSPDLPPRNPYSVASRKNWEAVVNFCRQSGGCKECTAGRCPLHGHGVSYAEHKAHLAGLNMVPEKDEAGNWFGHDPAKDNPLDDPAHPFAKYKGSVYFPSEATTAAEYAATGGGVL